MLPFIIVGLFLCPLTLQASSQDLINQSFKMLADHKNEAKVLSENILKNTKGLEVLQTQESPCGRCQKSPNTDAVLIEESRSKSLQEDSPDSRPRDDLLGEEGMLIFVSFSMPDASLKTLLLQANQRGVRVVIRGLIDNSWKKTQEKLMAFGENIDIDPKAFEHFGVHVVPTFVRLKKGGFDTLQGNVSLDYAVEKFESENPS